MAMRASTNSRVRATAACTQTRSFWGWRRGADYSSHLDPVFHRFIRFRTLKTRAKLLEKLRRHGRWNWDAEERPFFTSKHIRLASHFNGNGRPRWSRFDENEPARKQDAENAAEEEGYELSQREKEWKDQMDAMRKRLEQDPYEAVFGKRFEPFWGPLVPSWMREEMGLQGWPKFKETSKTNAAETPTAKPETKPTNPTVSPSHVAKESPPSGPVKKEAEADTNEGPNGQLTNYSYASSTSWNSWTNKTHREEWDSISGETKRYEYDPITNRMVQIEPTNTAVPIGPSNLGLTKAPPTAVEVKQTQMGAKVKVEVKTPSNSEPTDIPLKLPKEGRKPILVPTAGSDGAKKTSSYFPSLLNGPLHTVVKSSALEPSSTEKDLDLLTAEDVRSTMGKTKPVRGPMNLTQDQPGDARAERHGKIDLGKSEWDQAELSVTLDRELDLLVKKKEKLLKHEHGLFHIERQKKELQKLDERIDEITRQVRELDSAHARKAESVLNVDNSVGKLPEKLFISSKLKTSLERKATEKRSKVLAMVDEPDDSAAHESTGDNVNVFLNNVPKHWEKQADLLQADRIQRTRDTTNNSENGQKPKLQVPRWIDDMNARKAEYDAKKAQEKARNAEKNAKLEKANAMLEAEVKETKFRMQAHENRYAHKIRSLRQELEQAHKQSNSNAEMHVERIRNLEKELERAQKAAGDSTEITKYVGVEGRYTQKIRDLRKELDTTFKQSSVNAEMQIDRIKQLEEQLEKALRTSFGHDGGMTEIEKSRYLAKIQALRQELDIAFRQSSINAEMQVERIRALEKELNEVRNSTQKASRVENEISTAAPKDSDKWHRQTDFQPAVPSALTRKDAEKTTQKQRDQALVRQIKAIYEKRYGTIDYDHRQPLPSQEQVIKVESQKPQVVEVESNVDLGKALADYEKEQEYSYDTESFAAEIAAQEREAHEAQALMDAQTTGKMRQIIANNLRFDRKKLDTVKAPALEDHGLAGPAESAANRKVKSIQRVDTNVNPVDGTARSHLEEPSIGSFASPTGFVGNRWDSFKNFNVHSKPGKEPRDAEVSDFEHNLPQDESIRIVHYPRVKREERIFSGSRLGQRSREHERRRKRHHHQPTEEQLKEMKHKWKSYRARMRWALGVGVGAAALAYTVGAAAEKKERREIERWQQILDGKRSRWE